MSQLDLITREVTAFRSFADLIAANYAPTITHGELADAFDREQQRRGSTLRAWRGLTRTTR